MVGAAVIAVAVTPFFVAGVILLIGGAVRQGRARETPPTGPQRDPSKPADGPGAGP